MYLAALVGENPLVSTYFIATAEGVGGGGPTKKPTLKTQAKKQRQQNLNRLLTSLAIPVPTLHGSPSFG